MQGAKGKHRFTVVGEQQAADLGETLKAVGHSPDVVYSSPAVRTMETARIALSAMNRPTTIKCDDHPQELEQGE